jgi:cytochrome c biogenesis factor
MIEAGPGYYNDVVVRGNTFNREYQCKLANGDPADLTGYIVRWRGVYGDVTLEKTTSNGSLIMTTPSNGTAILILTPAETRLIPAEENMRYELEIIAPDLSELTILWGALVGKGGANRE